MKYIPFILFLNLLQIGCTTQTIKTENIKETDVDVDVEFLSMSNFVDVEFRRCRISPEIDVEFLQKFDQHLMLNWLKI